MFRTRARSRLARIGAAGFALLLLVSAGLWWVFGDAGVTRITAYFDNAVGVYPGSDVRVLGIRVGRIDEVAPEGKQVRVRMTVRNGVSVPAKAQAVVVSPSVVSDRYVQLAPVYRGGTKLPTDSVIPVERTATPAELDQLYSSLSDLANQLGPGGANSQGALSKVLDVMAQNLGGNGRALGDVIKELGKATTTLSGSQNDLFDTVDGLQKFTAVLAGSDDKVRQATDQLAGVSGFLAQDRKDLGAAMDKMAGALEQVQAFIRDNRDLIKSNVDKLAAVTKVLVDQRASLAEALDDAPLAITNLLGTYDPKNNTLGSRTNLLEYSALPLPLTGATR
ncbi:MCE family protein [Kutzneria viridogrisea]|uniref:Virulence factor Mce-like protein n=1 Tax=Kutzneria viridogrisea TaxID=47990 RepID=A0ABR6BDZ8_9PSEU|nr:virulence factor Mce-like protein [Kutzneria viridogrisea]